MLKFMPFNKECCLYRHAFCYISDFTAASNTIYNAQLFLCYLNNQSINRFSIICFGNRYPLGTLCTQTIQQQLGFIIICCIFFTDNYATFFRGKLV